MKNRVHVQVGKLLAAELPLRNQNVQLLLPRAARCTVRDSLAMPGPQNTRRDARLWSEAAAPAPVCTLRDIPHASATRLAPALVCEG